MKMDVVMSKRARAIATAVAGCLALGLTLARPAAADEVSITWDDGWGDGGDYYYYQERMQDNAIASQEEAAREAGRVVRRDEIAKEQAAVSAERQEYYASVMAASKASLTAPKGVYYRKPGFSTSSPPGTSAQPVAVGNLSYLYDEGVFWFARGDSYVVVTAPVGAVVDKMPAGVRVMPLKSGTLFYYFGTFFVAKSGKYEVIKPPAGTIVGYLPDGYTEEAGKEGSVFKFGETAFKQVFVQGVLAYQVI